MLPRALFARPTFLESAFPDKAARMIAASAAIALAIGAFTIAPPAVAQTKAPAMTEERLDHDGRSRRFLVHDYSGGKPAPTIILLHGGGGWAENAVNMTQFDAVAEREHLVAVYPDGTGGTPGGKLLTWNAGHCCAYARENKVDDVGFISAMIDKLVASGRTDPKRVYVTGMSNGGMMSFRLGRELSDKVAAIAPVVGGMFGDEAPGKGPMPAIIIVGAIDATVPGAGGPIGGNRGEGPLGKMARPPADRDVIPARATADYWARANGCADPVASQPKGADLVLWQACKAGAEVAFYTVANNGHAWPGGKAGRAEAAQPTQDFNASETMWAFFKRHPR